MSCRLLPKQYVGNAFECKQLRVPYVWQWPHKGQNPVCTGHKHTRLWTSGWPLYRLSAKVPVWAAAQAQRLKWPATHWGLSSLAQPAQLKVTWRRLAEGAWGGGWTRVDTDDKEHVTGRKHTCLSTPARLVSSVGNIEAFRGRGYPGIKITGADVATVL